MNDKQRAEFERWAKSIPFANLNRHLDGYENSSINTYWAVWQAAIASVVVELPELCTYDLSSMDITFNHYDADEMKSALDKAGIRYE